MRDAIASQRTRWLRRFGVLAVVGIALWIFASLLAVDELTSRASKRLNQEPLPDLAGHSLETLRLKTSDGEDIGAWFVQGDADQPAVVLFHGNRASRSSRVDELRFLIEERCSVLSVTFRAHGDSSGDRNDFGYSARHDVIAAVREMKRRCPQQPLLIWSGSLGAAAAIFAANELQSDVASWLFECPYRDLETAVRNRLRTRLPNRLAELAWWNLRLAAAIQFPHWQQISPIKAAIQFPPNVPVVIVAGGLDMRSTQAESEELAAAIGSQARVAVVPDADHMQTFARDRQPYAEWLNAARQLR